MVTGCIFCDPKLDRGRRLYETDNFFVNVGVGVAAPGHVMLIPKAHCDCYAEMPAGLRPEFLELKKFVFGKVRDAFGAPFMVEYGILQQSVRHAHLHFIPKERPATEFFCGYKIDSLLEAMGISGVLAGQPATWENAAGMRQANGGYIYLEDGDPRLFAEFPEGFNPKNLSYRDLLSRRMGVADIPAFWQEMTENDRQVDAIKRKITAERLKF